MSTSSWYGNFLLDPYAVLSFGFRRRIATVRTYVMTESGTLGPFPSKAQMFFRQIYGGCGTSWVVYTTFSIVESTRIRRVVFTFTTTDGYVIAVSLEVDVRLVAGTYMVIYTTCIRSTDPIILALRT